MSEPRTAPVPARCLAALVSLLVAASAALAFAAGPAAADDAADEIRLFQLTNESRAAYGRAPLAYDAAASSVARAWAAELARSGNLRHNPNLVSQVSSQVTNQWSAIGENVGYAGSVDQVHGAYMGSTGHRNNILGNYNRVGVGSVRAGNYVWTTVVFILGPQLVQPASVAPFPTAAAFVHQQFADFLGRAPDTAGLWYWVNLLQTGQVNSIGLVDSFINSAEFGQVVEPVARLYLAYFGRDPDFAGLMFWANQIRAGYSVKGVSQSFATSSEFQQQYGSLSNSAFVDRVYRNVLGRAADSGGLSYWVSQLNSGALTRGDVMLNFSESAEYRWATWARTDVVMAYLGFLRRSPDAGGLDYWMGMLYSGQGMGGLISGFLNSAEYRQRLGL
jgi:uncharacterized protein YkwD